MQYTPFPNIDLTTQSLDTTSKNDIIGRKLEYEDTTVEPNGDIFTDNSGVEQITHDVPIVKDTEEHETRDMSEDETRDMSEDDTINFIKGLKRPMVAIESDAMKAAVDEGYKWNSLSRSVRLDFRRNILNLNEPFIDAIKIASTQVKKNKLKRLFRDDAQYEKFTDDRTDFIMKYYILRSIFSL